jgi:4'-phosphopantetheinyl transferase
MDNLPREIARFAAAPPRAWVWVLPLAGLPSGAVRSLGAVLGDDERSRAAAFHFEKDAMAYAAAHALLRWALGVRYRRAPREWRFDADALAKPAVLLPGADARLSLSHTHGLVAIGLAEGADIGVDAEAIKADSDHADIARECFSAAERKQLVRSVPGFASEGERFYAFWTLKEALLKAKGLGLHQAPNTFTIDLRAMNVQALPEALAPVHEWHLECHKATPGHLVSVALDAPREQREVVISVIDDAASWVDGFGKY